MGVASLVLEDGGYEDEAIAALLHDAVEDQGGARTLGQIRQLFGRRVADIVQACSDTDETPKPPWRQRKEDYIAHLHDPALPPGTLRVSLADKLHNARAILFDLRAGHDVYSRFSAPRADQLWYYDALGDGVRRAHRQPDGGGAATRRRRTRRTRLSAAEAKRYVKAFAGRPRAHGQQARSESTRDVNERGLVARDPDARPQKNDARTRPLWAGPVDQDRVDSGQPVSAVWSEVLCKGAGDCPQRCGGLEDRSRFVRGPAIRWTIEIPASAGGRSRAEWSTSPMRISERRYIALARAHQGLSRGHGWS